MNEFERNKSSIMRSLPPKKSKLTKLVLKYDKETKEKEEKIMQ